MRTLILDRLQRNGRLSNAKLAQALPLSEPSCWRRVRRLEAEGVIEGHLAPILSALSTSGTAALFCIEGDRNACHRWLIAQRLAEQHCVTVEHLRPL